MPFFRPSAIVLLVLLLSSASHCQTPDTCEVTNTTVFRQLCSNVSSIIPFTRFPNVHGHSQQSDADASLSMWRSEVKSGCDIDVELFFCLYYFPTCRVTDVLVPVVQPPCRDFCLRIREESGCAPLFGLAFFDCSLLPPFDPANPTSCYDPYHLIVLNEVHSFNALNLNYVEFWDFGMKDTLLDSFTVVFFDFAGLLAGSFNLTGETTQLGYFTIGENSDIVFDDVLNTLAVALYRTKRQETT